MSEEQKYFHVVTKSTSKEDYFNIYYALDKDGYTIRSVEVKQDGSIFLANELVEVGPTFLPEGSFYPITDIASEYQIQEIDLAAFEFKWSEAVDFVRNHKIYPVLTGVIY